MSVAFPRSRPTLSSRFRDPASPRCPGPSKTISRDPCGLRRVVRERAFRGLNMVEYAPIPFRVAALSVSMNRTVFNEKGGSVARRGYTYTRKLFHVNADKFPDESTTTFRKIYRPRTIMYDTSHSRARILFRIRQSYCRDYIDTNCGASYEFVFYTSNVSSVRNYI